MWALGATSINNNSYILLCDKNNKQKKTFTIRKSKDGMQFITTKNHAKIINSQGLLDNITNCTFVNLSKDNSYYYLIYKTPSTNKLCIARSKNLTAWKKRSSLNLDCANGKIVSDYKYSSKNIMFTGGKNINLYFSSDFKKWKCVKANLLKINTKIKQLVILDSKIIKEGIFVIYAKITNNQPNTKNNIRTNVNQYKLFGVLFDKKEPTKLLWESSKAIYSTKNTSSSYGKLFGAVLLDEYLISYWIDNKDEIFLIRHFYSHRTSNTSNRNSLKQHCFNEDNQKLAFTEQSLTKPSVNPIMTPRKKYSWEALATYNPTAIIYNDTIHIIYRADGHDLMSVWGYASTLDGININNRLPHAIYQHNSKNTQTQLPSPTIYTSGSNSNGGCEDPRAVLIDDVIYITFTAFNGWGSVRVALTSIRLKDFLNKNWNWKKTVLISPPGETNKNWVIFPEKINGKFAILHSFYPNILIDYFDSLDELDGKTFIHSNNTRPVDQSRGWDSWFRGVGPAPLKTKDGWLVFYHAMNHKNPDRYKLGALLLDLNDPRKILYRSNTPILEPEKNYENNGIKWGVVYSCGAIIKDDTVFIYYGGSDKFVCVATIPLEDILSTLKKTGGVKMIIR